MTVAAQKIFLHGWGFSSQVVALLDEAHTYNAPCLYTLANKSGYTAIVEAVIDMITTESVLIGWSMGGQIAIEVAAQTEKVRGLVLLASAPVLVNKDDWQYGIDNLAFEKLRDSFAKKPAAAISNICSLTAFGESDYKQALNTLSGYKADTGHAETLEVLLDELETRDCRQQFKQLGIPIQVCIGEKDALLNPGVANALQQDNTHIRTLHDSGHAPFISHSTIVSETVKQLGVNVL